MGIVAISRDQRVRFVLVGATNTLVGYGIFLGFEFFVFASLQFGYLLSMLLSYMISISLAFLMYRRFVFRVTGNWFLDLLRFFSVYLLAIFVNLLGLALLVDGAQLPSWLSQAIMLGITTVMSYVGHRWFSFRRPKSELIPGKVSDEFMNSRVPESEMAEAE